MSYNRDIYEEIRDPEFAEHFLGRLVADCEYILGACMDAYEKGYANSKKGALIHLWAQNDVDEQISLMRACKRTLDKHKIKSRISNEDINDYESKLKRIEKFNESNSSLQTLKKEIRELYEDMKEYYLNDSGYFDTDEIKYFRHNLKSANKKELINIVEDILEEIYTEIQNEEDDFGEADYDIINYRDNFEEILERIKMSSWKENNLIKRGKSLKEASSLSYKTEDGKMLNFYNDENFPVSLNELPYEDEFDLYKRIYLKNILKFFKAYDADEYSYQKKHAFETLNYIHSSRNLIRSIEEMLESMYEALEYAEDQSNNGGIYYNKKDYDIIKDCVDEMEDLLDSVKKYSKLNESKSHLLEGYHHPFDRNIKEDVIKPYKYYYKSLDFKKDYKTKVYGYENYNIISVSYNGTSRTLKIEAVIGLKAYGDGYEKRCIYKGDRSKYDRNTFEFDEYLSQNIANIIYPIGLVKTDLYYPTKYFHYSDYHQDAPEKLHWVDHVILDVTKVYD